MVKRIVAALCMLCLLFPTIASAEISYKTWYVDQLADGRQLSIQPLYIPQKVVDDSVMNVPFNAPSDLFVAGDDHVYIADTGNNRIVELNADGGYVRSIGEEEGPGKLNQPEGVFVTADGTIYAANTGDQTIVKFAPDGKLLRVFPKPQSNMLGDDYYFLPTRLAVDNRGVMYVVVKDTYQGLLRMNPEGEFTGFFGANKTKLTLLDRLKRAILSKEQLAKETAKRPNSIENVTLTSDGFLVTASSGNVNDGQIKKLNAGGVDGFRGKAFEEWDLVDVAIDPDGFLYGINRSDGKIAVYDPTGNVMFYFGGGDKNARQLGVTNFATSIAVNGRHELWVADKGTNLIHVFQRTGFGDTFLTAAHLYFEGDYEASKAYWEEVTRENGMLNMPVDGLGKIALHDKEYGNALDYFKQSYDAEGYSSAFWNVRYDFIQRYFLVALILLVLAVWGFVFLWRKGKAFAGGRAWPPKLRQYGEELRDALYLIVHPYEGFYRLKDRNISWVVIVLILALAVAVKLVSVFGMGFLAHPYDIGRVNMKLTIGMMIVPWSTWVVANYLVSAVKGGEGRFREVLQASTYAVVPYIVLTIPTILLSRIVVLEEWVVIDLLQQLMWLWIVLLFFVMTQVIHNFDFLEAIRNGCITLFTIGVIWIFVTIFVGLGVNLYDFLGQIYREVTFHG